MAVRGRSGLPPPLSGSALLNQAARFDSLWPVFVVRGDDDGLGEEPCWRWETAVMDLVCTASLGLHAPFWGLG